MAFDGDDTATETQEDPYPPRRKFAHASILRVWLTVASASISSAALVLTAFTFISDAKLDSRMLVERDWIDQHYVSERQEVERVKALDERLQEIREVQIQIATSIHDLQVTEQKMMAGTR